MRNHDSAQAIQIIAKTHINVKHREEALKVLVKLLEEADCIKESFWAALLEREEKFPTGLVLDGPVNVALPHTDIEHVKCAGFAVGVLDEPVQFHNMCAPEELVDVNVIFVLAAENPKAVIDSLQKLTENVFQNKEVMGWIANAEHDGKLLQYLSEVIGL
jgi:PTS system galactitol-specific IIA component